MNKFSILGLVMIVVAIFIFINASRDVSTYANFSDAVSSGNRVKIVGKLNKSVPTVYDAQNDPNVFKFHMVDDKGTEKEVVLLKPKQMVF